MEANTTRHARSFTQWLSRGLYAHEAILSGARVTNNTFKT